MGHSGETGDHFDILQHRLADKLQANPCSPTLVKILRLLFTPQEAELAAQLPHNLTPVSQLAHRLAIPLASLRARLSDLAQRGLIFDMEVNGERYVTLPPVVIGFFEFVFMRARPELPMAELARLFEDYFTENDAATARAFFQGQTQQARSFVREESLPQGDHAEILDWERASQIVESASAIAVGFCQCHHLAQHLATACDRPQEVCLSFNYAAKSLSRNGLARVLSRPEAMAVLTTAKQAGLIQVGDNVQRKVSFLCNCCGCCCHLIRGVKLYDLKKSVVSSNWLVEVDAARCTGCGECARACPVGAIRMEGRLDETRQEEGRSRRRLAVRDAERCLGCGLCPSRCATGAAVLRPRPQRVLVPETIFDQRLAMAIERGRLADMLFDDPGRLSHRALGRIVGAIERTSGYKALMAAESIKSTFLKALVMGAKQAAGGVGREFL